MHLKVLPTASNSLHKIAYMGKICQHRSHGKNMSAHYKNVTRRANSAQLHVTLANTV